MSLQHQFQKCDFKLQLTCAPGLSCIAQNEYYSQCLKNGEPKFEDLVQLYDQCDGQGSAYPKRCNEGLVCSFRDQYYSQCLLLNSGPVISQAPVVSQIALTQISVPTQGVVSKAQASASQIEPVLTQVAVTKPELPVTEAPPIASQVVAPPTTGITPLGPVQKGETTRYWDCCKPSCAWKENVGLVTAPVNTCQVDGASFAPLSFMSGCNGGDAFMCSNNQPFQVSPTLAYGFAAASIAGKSEKVRCCSCFKLDFTSGTLKDKGKSMIVQVTNSGGDLRSNHFDIQLPGGGVGIFNGCSRQYGAPESGWGARYGGISSLAECKDLPEDLCIQPTKKFRHIALPNQIQARRIVLNTR